MNLFENFRRQVKIEVFDYLLLVNYLKDLKKPRDKISAFIEEGKIVRLKKGLYLFGEEWREAPLNLEMIANLLYGPSCVSFEYALNRYGLISERSATVTSLAIGDSKTFHTAIGTFEYRAIDQEKFKREIEYRNAGKEGGYFIASKEKALVDLIYRTPGIRTLDQLRYFLFEEMRVDETLFRALDFGKIERLAKVYKKLSITLMSKV